MRRLRLRPFLFTGIAVRLVMFALASIATAEPTAARPITLTLTASPFHP